MFNTYSTVILCLLGLITSVIVFIVIYYLHQKELEKNSQNKTENNIEIITVCCKIPDIILINTSKKITVIDSTGYEQDIKMIMGNGQRTGQTKIITTLNYNNEPNNIEIKFPNGNLLTATNVPASLQICDKTATVYLIWNGVYWCDINFNNCVVIPCSF